MASIRGDKQKSSSFGSIFTNIAKTIAGVNTYGMKLDSQVRRNSAMSVSNSRTDIDAEDGFLQLSFSNISTNGIKTPYADNIPYPALREGYRVLAVQDEIEDILDILCDDTIINEPNTGRFAELSYKDNLSKDINVFINHSYDNIYNLLGFNAENKAWHVFRKWLVDGRLAFEIVYDKDNNIIGFIELDTACLSKLWDENSGQYYWEYRPLQSTATEYKCVEETVRFHENQILFISYSDEEDHSRISYVERLSRPFNVLRTMEASRIIWAVTNCSYKTQFNIPVGSVQSPRGRQTLAKACANYREIVDFNWDTGEIKTNGKPMMPFYKEYWFPTENGESPQISTMSNDGPQLNDTETLSYFKMKLTKASKIPSSRFDDGGGGYGGGGATYTTTAEGIARDEVRYANFIGRLRCIFQDIIIKPLYLSIMLKYPALQNDTNFKASLKLKFHDDMTFKITNELETLEKRLQTIGSFSQITVPDDEGNEIPYFDQEFLIKRYLGMSEADITENENIKKKKKLLKKYKPEDVDKIMDGAPEDDFEPIKKDDDEEGGGDDAGGGGGGGFKGF